MIYNHKTYLATPVPRVDEIVMEPLRAFDIVSGIEISREQQEETLFKTLKEEQLQKGKDYDHVTFDSEVYRDPYHFKDIRRTRVTLWKVVK